MRVKTRPGLHYASVPGGVFVSSNQSEFCVRGSDLLYLALDTLFPILTRGADEEELVETLGGEPARAVVRALVQQLSDHRMLLDLGALTQSEPGADVRAAFPEALAYLENVTDDPYATFARLQISRVRLSGPEPVVGAAQRALRRAGVGHVELAGRGWTDGPVDVEVVFLDGADDGPVVGAAPVLRVHLTDTVALVGPLVAGTDPRATELWQRTRAWSAYMAAGPLVRPGNDTLASAYAAMLVLEWLIDGSDRRAMVLGVNLPGAEEVVFADAESGGTHRLTAAVDRRPRDDDLLALVEQVTAAWTGLYDARGGADLPQMPTALRHGVPVAHRGPVRVSPGANQEQAAVALALQMRRDAGGEGFAAGLTRQRWLLDGALRVLAHEAALSQQELPALSPETERLWRAVGRESGISMQVGLRSVPGLGWVLADVDLGVGHCSAWAPDADRAVADALSAAVALFAGRRSEPPAFVDELSTDALSDASEPVVTTLAADLVALAGNRCLEVVGTRADGDPARRQTSLWSGSVHLVSREEVR